MSSELYVLVGSAIATLVGSVFTYLKYIRRTSGSIRTTTADKLWEEAGTIRDSMAAELVELKEKVEIMLEKMIKMDRENSELTGRLGLVEQEARECREREVALNIRVAELELAAS